MQHDSIWRNERVGKSNTVEHKENEDQEGRVYNERIKNQTKRIKEKLLALYTFNIYVTKSSLIINGPQTPKFALEVIPII